MVRSKNGFLWLLALLLAAGCGSTSAEQHLENARARMAEGEVRTAVIELKNALQKSPDLADARLLLGEAHDRLGDYPSALKEFERALDLGLDNERVRAGLLRSKVRLGRFNEVIGELEGRSDLTPPLAVVLGDAYLDAGDLAGARSMYERGRPLPESSLGLGTIAWQEGDTAAAAVLLQEAVDQDSGNSEAWLRKGEFELSRGATDPARAAFSAATKLQASRVAGHIGLARVALIAGDLDAAAADVKRVLDLAPDYPGAHYLDGLIRYERQDIDGAEAAIREVQRVVPDHGPSLYLMGAIKYQQGQRAQAEENLQRYLAQDPANESAAKLLASVAFDRGDQARVVELLDPHSADTADPQLLAMLGAARMRLGQPTAATPLLERAVALAPDMAPFRNQLALSLLAGGDRTRAEAELEGAIEVDGQQFESDYLLVMLQMRERDWRAADESIRTLIEKNPDGPVGYNLRGALAVEQGDAEAARSAFAAALQRDPGFFPAVQNLARLAQQEGDSQRAIELFQDFLERNPADEGALLALAELSLGGGRSDQALDYLERAVAENPESVRARLALAQVLLAAGRLDQSAVVVDQALERAPDLAQLSLLRAEIDWRRGDLQKARTLAARLQSRLVRDAADASLVLALGDLQSRLGQLSEARSNLERVLTLADGDNAAAQRSLARIDLAEGKVREARARVDLLLEEASDADTRLLSADVLLAEGRGDEAQRQLEQLASSGEREAVIRLAGLQLGTGDVSGAVARLEGWLQDHPGDRLAELLLADALMATDKRGAIVRYENLLDTGNPVVLNNLAWLYMEQGDDRAVATARRAADVAPDNAEVLDTLGWVLLQQGGRVDEALRVLRRSAQLKPDNPSIQYHLGIALRESGDVAGARAALTRALEASAFPEADQARDALAGLPTS
ncbi:MAG: PEP-CTERM system TPR-repeat protein PrsT [Pseudomonadales bacterium]